LDLFSDKPRDDRRILLFRHLLRILMLVTNRGAWRRLNCPGWM
jgi:hypothetical protein